MIHRRDELRAAGVLQDALLALPNVEMVWDTVVDSIEGNEMVSGVKVTNKKAGEAGMITVDVYCRRYRSGLRTDRRHRRNR